MTFHFTEKGMSNIVLIGMPACGKSTVGVVLAKTIGKSFVDTDLLIQEQEETLLQDLIDEKGNAYFQQVEAEVLSNLNFKNAVISTGGSAVYDPEAMHHLGQNGIIVYLELSLETIIQRLDNISTRGITMAKGETMADVYQRRIPLYEKYAHHVISGEGKDVEAVVAEIIKVVMS